MPSDYMKLSSLPSLHLTSAILSFPSQSLCAHGTARDGGLVRQKHPHLPNAHLQTIDFLVVGSSDLRPRADHLHN